MDLKNLDKEIDISIRTIKGEFYTPKLWVDQSHEFITSKLGNDWYNKLVWDCAWGTGNLTSDYRYGNLMVSTL
jgi:uncharacterized protein (DUF2164 family)